MERSSSFSRWSLEAASTIPALAEDDDDDAAAPPVKCRKSLEGLRQQKGRVAALRDGHLAQIEAERIDGGGCSCGRIMEALEGSHLPSASRRQVPRSESRRPPLLIC